MARDRHTSATKGDRNLQARLAKPPPHTKLKKGSDKRETEFYHVEKNHYGRGYPHQSSRNSGRTGSSDSEETIASHPR